MSSPSSQEKDLRIDVIGFRAHSEYMPSDLPEANFSTEVVQRLQALKDKEDQHGLNPQKELECRVYSEIIDLLENLILGAPYGQFSEVHEIMRKWPDRLRDMIAEVDGLEFADVPHIQSFLDEWDNYLAGNLLFRRDGETQQRIALTIGPLLVCYFNVYLSMEPIDEVCRLKLPDDEAE